MQEPSFAERARTLLYLGRVGSLATQSLKQPGSPFGSVMPYALDDNGRPIFLIGAMAMHIQNLRVDSRASLLMMQPEAGGDVLGASRVTLVGDVSLIAGAEIADARKLYLTRHENSKYWVDFDDFSFYRMPVVDIYYVGGFGVMGWVTAEEYKCANPDPLASAIVFLMRMEVSVVQMLSANSSQCSKGLYIRESHQTFHPSCGTRCSIHRS